MAEIGPRFPAACHYERAGLDCALAPSCGHNLWCFTASAQRSIVDTILALRWRP